MTVATQSIYTTFRCRDAMAEIEFLERARANGAEIVRELTDEDYGSRGYTARDPEGNLWSFGTYRPESG
jgi:uncharacterized glyoxalase superfamily protein PhnB